MERKKCTTAGCGCFAYISDLTDRRICTCGHAAAHHETEAWECSALPVVAGTTLQAATHCAGTAAPGKSMPHQIARMVVPTFTVLGLTAGLTILGRARRDVSWQVMLRLVPTTLIGVGVGLYLFSRLDARTLTLGLAVLVVAYGVYSLIKTFRAKSDVSSSPKILAPAAGLLAGAVGTTFGMMAAVLYAIYFDAIEMPKDAFRATMSAVLLLLGVIRGIGYLAIGQYTHEVYLALAITLPTTLLGIYIGDRVHTGMSELAFRRVISGALIVSGGALLWK
jgi:uncharacterized protein